MKQTDNLEAKRISAKIRQRVVFTTKTTAYDILKQKAVLKEAIHKSLIQHSVNRNIFEITVVLEEDCENE